MIRNSNKTAFGFMSGLSHQFTTFCEKPFFLPALLLLQFCLHLLIYFNTTSFIEISEAGALLGNLDKIRAGEHPLPLYGFYWYFTPAYIAYFLEAITGTVHAYFVFQCLLSSFTTYLIYKLVVAVTNSKLSGIVAVILMILYMEFTLLSSVFYNQVYEIFFSSVFLLFNILLFKATGTGKIIIYSLGAILSVLLSLLFRSTLLYTFFYLLIISIILLFRRELKQAIKFLLPGVILFVTIFFIRPYDKLREGEFKAESTLSFWGHTTYGGNGGEVGFIYKENEERFNKRLKEYAAGMGYDTIDETVILNFKKHEVKQFITHEPHKWIFLQVKKFFYTFGAVPQRDGLRMLRTGRVPMGWATAAIILQASFYGLILLFILTMDLKLRTILDIAGMKLFLYLFGVYLICAICFYSAYSERYRIVFIVSFLIPVIAINFKTLTDRILLRQRLWVRLTLIGIIVLIWAYQAYEALIIHHERYFNALTKMVTE